MKKLYKNNKGKIIFFSGIFLTILAPFIVTRPAYYEWLSLVDESFANIGVTIGGITAPIVGLVGAWLLFLTLQEQKNANRDNILLNSIQQMDNLIIVSGILEFDAVVVSKLEKKFNPNEIDDKTGCPKVNSDFLVVAFAHKHVFTMMNIALQIEIIFNGINDSSNDIIKQRLAGIIYNLKKTIAYNSILQSATSIFEDKSTILSPISTINSVEEGLKEWHPKSTQN